MIMASTHPLLELQAVTTGYGDVPVVRNANMRFETGLMTAIIGSNGAGKSTAIKAAAGLLRVWSARERRPISGLGAASRTCRRAASSFRR